MNTKDFSMTYKVSSFELDKDNILIYDANSKIIYLSKEYDSIDIYSIETKTKICSKKFDSEIIHFQSHSKYYNILSISLTNSNVLLFHIDINNKKLEQKVIYQNPNHGIALKTIFSPYENGTILSSLFTDAINIWDIKRYNYLYYIYFGKKIKRSSNPEIKWSESGKYLIFQRYHSIIEIYSLLSKKIEYSIKSSSKHYFFNEKEKKIIFYEKGFIIINDITNNKQIYKISCDTYECEKAFFNENNNLFYFIDNENFFVYDLISRKKIFEYKVNNCDNFILLKNSINNNEPKLLSKLILCTNDKKFDILSIYNENYINININEPKEEIALDTFWENSIKIIKDEFEFLSYEYNRYNDIDIEIKPKNYLLNKEIEEEFDYLLKNKTLEEKMELIVNNYKVNFTKNDNIDMVYINYIKNLIKDNTNIELLIDYLSFLQKNNDKLEKIYGNNFENFNDEIAQYQICFEKLILKEKFNYIKIKSEKEKLIDLLHEILKIKDWEDVKNIVDKEKNIFNIFKFNQPVSFKNKELYFCQYKLIILNSLKDILKYKDIDLLENMKYCINKILDRNILNDFEIIYNCLKINLLFILISSPQKKIIIDYNFNLINDKNNNINEDILFQLGFEYNKNNESYEYENKKIIIQKNEIKLINLENLKLFLKYQSFEEKENNNVKNYELYKYDDMLEYYKKHFDENKLREFISNILTSNVIKELFRFLYGDDIKYPFLDAGNKKGKDKAFEYLKKYLKFIPLKFENKNSVTNKFTMETYMFLNSNIISKKIKKHQNVNIKPETINKALINGVIVLIYFNELNNNFLNYYNFSQNGKKCLKTPKKKYIENNESINEEFYMEYILFGKVLNNLSLRQILYILNEDNYTKPLYQYRLDFLKIKDEDCECKGTFEEYSIMKIKDLGKFLDYEVVKLKLNLYHTPLISIHLKNDVLGFRSFHSNDSYP